MFKINVIKGNKVISVQKAWDFDAAMKIAAAWKANADSVQIFKQTGLKKNLVKSI